jgi:CubicO group peptidase (beta-lactamase class C family)
MNMKHFQFRLLVLLTQCLLIACKLPAQTANLSPLLSTDSLDAYVTKAMAAWNVPGVAICIVHNGQVLLQKGYGLRTQDGKSQMNEHTLFPIASLTKTLTGTLLGTLAAQGKVNLDTPLVRWLPQFTMKDKAYESQITLKDLLSHRSGWKTFQGDLLNTESNLNKDLSLRYFGQLTPAYPIRSRFGYSNFGFLLAGEAVRPISDISWAEAVQQTFLAPLGMQRTLMYEEQIAADPNKVSAHTERDGKVVALPPDKIDPQPYGGLFSTANDMGIWMTALLNNGQLEGRSIIPPAAIAEMWKSHTIIGKERAADRQFYLKTYGLGWEIMQYAGHEVVQHGGAYNGVLTTMGLVPDQKTGVVVLTNRDGHLLHEVLKWQILDALIGKPAPDYVQVVLERQAKRKQQPKPDANKAPSADIKPLEIAVDQLVGTYVCDAYGTASIRLQNQKLMLTLEHHPGLEGVLTFADERHLTCNYNHPMFGTTRLPFAIAGNEVSGFTLFVDPFVEADGYYFRKLTNKP